jgi:hypothetical protein
MEGPADRYVVIDGYKRIAALEQLGRDTVEVVIWPMSEAAAVLLDRSLRLSEHETALEVGWLLAEFEQRFGYSLDELARRFDRSVSWVSRRLALVEVLPEAIQQQVREGQILAQVALKFLVPVARQSLEDCQRMAAIFAQHHCETREAGQLYEPHRKWYLWQMQSPAAGRLKRPAWKPFPGRHIAWRTRRNRKSRHMCRKAVRRSDSVCAGESYLMDYFLFLPLLLRAHFDGIGHVHGRSDFH